MSMLIDSKTTSADDLDRTLVTPADITALYNEVKRIGSGLDELVSPGIKSFWLDINFVTESVTNLLILWAWWEQC